MVGAIYHVVEHFAMHTGQIVFTHQDLPLPARFTSTDAGGVARPTWQRGSELDEAAHSVGGLPRPAILHT